MNSTTAEADAEPALVTGAFSRRMCLRLGNGGQVEARIKGKTLRPVCGDHVLAVPIANEPDWLVMAIEPRQNELTRADSRGKTEVLAANIDCVVAMAAAQPAPDWFVIDRYLAAAETMDALPVVVFNKTDLPLKDPSADQIMADFRSHGYAIVSCSAETGEGLKDLAALLKDRIAIIVGQSGVGKSSVINRLTGGSAQRIGELSAGSGEGRHTTVSSVMLDIRDGGVVIDSPGVRDYAPAIQDAESIARGFREISETSQQCRFANCRHLREPGCAVKAALDDGSISPRRYESYKRLMTLSRQLSERRS